MGSTIDFITDCLKVKPMTCDEIVDLYMTEYPKENRTRVWKKIRNKLYDMRIQKYLTKEGYRGNSYWRLV